MAEFFQFEADFVDSLRCIPMSVRYKLDTCGIKLKLAQWNRFSREDCQRLVELPCTTPAEVHRYRGQLQTLVREKSGEEAKDLAIDPHPPWLQSHAVPSAVQERATAAGVLLSIDQWAALSPLQRFALIKLSQSSHEGSNFVPALQEFGIEG